MSEAENASQFIAQAERLDKSGYGSVRCDPSQEKCLTNCENLTCELTQDGAGLLDCNKVSLQAKTGDASQVSSNCRLVEDTDTNSKYGEIVREPLCNAGNQSMLREPSEQESHIGNGDTQSEPVKCSTIASDCGHTEQQKECLSPEKIAAENSCEHGHDILYDLENNAVGVSSNMLDDIVPGQLTNNSSVDHSELKQSGGGNRIGNGDIQSEPVNCSKMASECGRTEQQKECLSPEKIAAEDSCDHGHDGLYDLENTAVGEISEMFDDIIPGQLTNNSNIELSELKQSGGGTSGGLHNITGGCTELCSSDIKDKLGPSFQDVTGESKLEQFDPFPDDTSKSTVSLVEEIFALQSAAKGSAKKQSEAIHQSPCEKSGAEVKSSFTDGSKSCRSSGRRQRKTPATKVKSEYTLRSSTGRRKGPRSFLKEKAVASEPDINVENVSDGRKRGRKKGRGNQKVNDEFSRMKMRLKYVLHRMSYEQNLIDAYSSEGWRGQSLEKLRPEQELQRAKLEINRYKLKIRALFQRIDEMCAEGRFPESLFDSEGLIDSEDIFCAKCGSKDLSRDNDIILCDGACDRGFHQLCLDPPLRTEEIPPGDEGWLCPACDCKFDCVELLNESLGAKISVNDSWEKVFPDAAAKAGGGQDDICGLPSDDSEDNDYNPGEADDDSMEEGESSSDESDFSSASEDLGAIHNNDEQYLGLPSDDSEDDDYDPSFVDADDQPKQESSSSDFTSASEDLNAAVNNDDDPGEDGCLMSPSKLVEDWDDSVPVSGRRQVEKLDYKKLYDETYGNASTDSSDDEDWKDAITPKRRKNGRRNTSHSSEDEELKHAVTPKRRKHEPRDASSVTANCDIPVAAGGSCNMVRNTSTLGKAPLSPQVGVSNDLQTPETSSGGKGNKKQPYKRLGEAVTQRLYASFKENQYPDRSTKEKIAGELGLSPKQVSKWFENARWSFYHSKSPRLPGKDNIASGDVASHEVGKAPVETSNNTNPRKSELDVGETSEKKTPCRSGRRRK